MNRRIYLDHAASTPMRAQAREALLAHIDRDGANPSSTHAEGRAARAALDDARSAVASCLGVAPREIVFTSSGTEANNLAILGAARARAAQGMHAITAVSEHPSALRAFERLRDDGVEVTFLPVDAAGMVDPLVFARAIRPGTVLASFMLANNEIGIVQPVRELAAIARERGVCFHTDAAQAMGRMNVDPHALNVDLLSFSARKLGGAAGVGVLYVRRGTALAPLLLGGSQEVGLRAGTENLPGVAACAAALEATIVETPAAAACLTRLCDRFEAGVLAAIPEVRINGVEAPRVPGISSISFADVDAFALLVRLDLEGIAVSTGSACAAGAETPSHVLAALGAPSWTARGVIRFSMGRMTTEDEVDEVLKRLPGIVESLRTYDVRETTLEGVR